MGDGDIAELSLTEACPASREGQLLWGGVGAGSYLGRLSRFWRQNQRLGTACLVRAGQTGRWRGRDEPWSLLHLSSPCIGYRGITDRLGRRLGGRESFLYNETFADGIVCVCVWGGLCVRMSAHVWGVWMCVCTWVHQCVRVSKLCVHVGVPCVHICVRFCVCVRVRAPACLKGVAQL